MEVTTASSSNKSQQASLVLLCATLIVGFLVFSGDTKFSSFFSGGQPSLTARAAHLRQIEESDSAALEVGKRTKGGEDQGEGSREYRRTTGVSVVEVRGQKRRSGRGSEQEEGEGARSSPEIDMPKGAMLPEDYFHRLMEDAVLNTNADLGGGISSSSSSSASTLVGSADEDLPSTTNEQLDPLHLPCKKIAREDDKYAKEVSHAFSVRTWDCSTTSEEYAKEIESSTEGSERRNERDEKEKADRSNSPPPRFWDHFPRTRFECKKGISSTDSYSINMTCFFTNLYYIGDKWLAVGMSTEEQKQVMHASSEVSLGSIPKIKKRFFRVGDHMGSLGEIFLDPSQKGNTRRRVWPKNRTTVLPNGPTSLPMGSYLNRFYAVDSMVAHFSILQSISFSHVMFGDLFPVYWMLRDFGLVKQPHTSSSPEGRGDARKKGKKEEKDSWWRKPQNYDHRDLESDSSPADELAIAPGDISLLVDDHPVLFMTLPNAKNPAWNMFSRKDPMWTGGLFANLVRNGNSHGKLGRAGPEAGIACVLFRKFIVGSGQKGWTHYMPDYRGPGTPHLWLGFRNYIVGRYLTPQLKIEAKELKVLLNPGRLLRWLKPDALPTQAKKRETKNDKAASHIFKRKMTVTFCHKKDKRTITNPEEVISWFRSDDGEKKNDNDDGVIGENLNLGFPEWLSFGHIPMPGMTGLEQLLLMLSTDIFICNEGTPSTKFFLMNPGSAHHSIMAYFGPENRPDPRKRVGGHVDTLPVSMRWIRSEHYENISGEEVIVSPKAQYRKANHNRNAEYDVQIIKGKLLALLKRAAEWVWWEKGVEHRDQSNRHSSGSKVELIKPKFMLQREKRQESEEEGNAEGAKAVVRTLFNTDGHSINGRICAQFFTSYPKVVADMINQRCKMDDAWYCEHMTNMPPEERKLQYKARRSRGRCWGLNVTKNPAEAEEESSGGDGAKTNYMKDLPLDPRDLLPVPFESKALLERLKSK